MTSRVDENNKEESFQSITLGEPFTFYQEEIDYHGIDGLVFNAIEDSGYLMRIYMADMQAEEVAIMNEQTIHCRVIQENEFIHTLIRFGDSMQIFELSFDPTIYNGSEAFQLALDNNMIVMVGIDSLNNIVKVLRFFSIAKMLRVKWLSAWTEAVKTDNYTVRYKRWMNDLMTRYDTMELWNRGTDVGHMGDE